MSTRKNRKGGLTSNEIDDSLQRLQILMEQYPTNTHLMELFRSVTHDENKRYNRRLKATVKKHSMKDINIPKIPREIRKYPHQSKKRRVYIPKKRKEAEYIEEPMEEVKSEQKEEVTKQSLLGDVSKMIGIEPIERSEEKQIKVDIENLIKKEREQEYLTITDILKNVAKETIEEAENKPIEKEELEAIDQIINTIADANKSVAEKKEVLKHPNLEEANEKVDFAIALLDILNSEHMEEFNEMFERPELYESEKLDYESKIKNFKNNLDYYVKMMTNAQNTDVQFGFARRNVDGQIENDLRSIKRSLDEITAKKQYYELPEEERKRIEEAKKQELSQIPKRKKIIQRKQKSKKKKPQNKRTQKSS